MKKGVPSKSMKEHSETANIPVVILCGGQSSRMRDVSESLPKPMIPIGGKPILWHIMKIYAAHGFKNFILALGYKGWVIKEYFLNYQAMNSDFTVSYRDEEKRVWYMNSHEHIDWHVVCAETGEHALTGGRIRRLAPYIETEQFMVTYGDGVGNVDVTGLWKFHLSHGKICTVTGVTPSGRFGSMAVDGDTVTEFNEKPDAGGGLINGGFFVFRRECLDMLTGQPDSMLEDLPMTELVKRKELMVYRHTGFWEPMDTMRDYNVLNEMWDKGQAPWKVWE